MNSEICGPSELTQRSRLGNGCLDFGSSWVSSVPKDKCEVAVMVAAKAAPTWNFEKESKLKKEEYM
jgi:hypothetical protein